MSIKQVIAVPLVFLTILLLCLVSCEEDSTLPVGENWIDVNTKVYFIDTLTVKATTFKFDSIIVSDASRLLIGAYTDPVFGISKSKSYIQLSNSVFSLDDDAVFDSITLVLKYDDYFYNDTIPTQKFNVYRVTQKIEPNDDDDLFYNTTDFTYDDMAPLASESFLAYPKKEDSVLIHLDNTFGKTLFDDIKDNEINDSEEFLYRYKGLLIEADTDNTAILGFSSESLLRIYYTIPGEIEDVSYEFDIAFNTNNTFNNISSDYLGTHFESLNDQDINLPSSSTDDASYIQAGTGISTRIEIPYIERINEIQGTGTILDANLKVSIKQNSSTDNLFTKDSLNIYIYNKNGEVLSNLVDEAGDTALGLIDYESSEYNIIVYSIPLKYFLDLKLETINDDNLFLAIYSQNYNESLDRYILNGENASDDLKAKLELTYAIYDN
ncbi:DUF4270 family protein [Flavivirga aquimarina]|uniref:DUF4270 family protein n=1 Tax=Flavivirga aquimarina TaxID=2027862 RepID=A0ABT8W8L0_9FLAO|nr:DUF4270 family protein [Flavivirga aquimarina]MDO5969421.1 DUF4270 family protein [Flavivirga aquimarina]